MAGPFFVAFNRTRGFEIACKVEKAEDYESRSRGLLGRERLEPAGGLWIHPCPMIHTFFMKFPIDVLFLDKGMTVVRVLENLKPWRLSPWVLSARSVLELRAGSLGGRTFPGDQVELVSELVP
ncbi:MAG: DUF192 domain-containing protein [Elusimicrobia bacterium]|nr:DUF192 domain-containing protein [Elusimicrobiota bacterium]